MEESNYNTHNYPTNFKVTALNKIKSFLLTSFYNNKQKIIDEFALKHRKETASIAGFRLEGECYLHQLVYAQPFKCKPLHYSFVSEFTDYIDSWNTHLDRQHTVDNILISAFNLMGNTNDLHKLLPECIHSTLPLLDSSKPTLSIEEINSFKELYSETLKLIGVQVVIKSIKG
jgi:hypothetical protein